MFASRIPRSLLTSFALCACLGALAPRLDAQTWWYVDASGTPPGTGSASQPYTSLQYAITRTSTVSGDTLYVFPGVYHERVDFLGKNLVVESDGGAALTAIDAGSQGSAVTFRNGEGSNCRLTGFTLRNGSGRFIAASDEALGGGIYCVNSSPLVVNCVISNNKTLIPGSGSTVQGRGGGVYEGPGSQLSLQNCSITGNDASHGGGIFVESATLDVQSGTIESNRALGGAQPARGGGIAAGTNAHLNLSSVTVKKNLALGNATGASVQGGGIRLDAGSSAYVNFCELSYNDSGGWSMGYGDYAGYGGGISSSADLGAVLILNTSLRNNWGNSGGGGMIGNGRLQYCQIEGNHGQLGGGVWAKNMVLENCVLRANRGSVSGTYDSGGGVFAAWGGYGLMQSCEIANNFAYGQGAGGYGGTYIDCDIHHNSAQAGIDGSPVVGGGVAYGSLTDCRVHDNVTHEYDYDSAAGGGIYGSTALRCQIYANTGDEGGGAAYSDLRNCTLVANRSTANPGGGVSGGSVHNSIVRFNLPDDVDTSAVVDWSNIPAGIVGIGNQNEDPQLWNVAARDYGLRPNSPCINAGYRGDPPDPDGSRNDMGALPFDPNHCGSPIVYCTAKTNSLGCTPAIGSNGLPSSASSGQFQVRANNVRNSKSGLLFWGGAAAADPFQGAFLCVALPIVRAAAQDSGGSAVGNDCSGTYAFTWSTAYLAANQLQVGDTIFCQFWSRDPGAVGASGLTNAIEFTLCP